MKAGTYLSVIAMCASIAANAADDGTSASDLAAYEAAVYVAFQDKQFFSDDAIVAAQILISKHAKKGSEQAQILLASLDKRSGRLGVAAR